MLAEEEISQNPGSLGGSTPSRESLVSASEALKLVLKPTRMKPWTRAFGGT